jgi:hypothetical protein
MKETLRELRAADPALADLTDAQLIAFVDRLVRAVERPEALLLERLFNMID